ncbi:MAG: cyclic pyranopterin monophosphate synthase MoaC [Actinobacteria bacterium]|nr:cyclic pyranopterin monophosphate synthase MoaC [Actinomycetota bacterium]
MTEDLTHLDDQGRVHMVDVGGKEVTRRVAVAEARLAMSAPLVERILAGDLPKGDVLAVARVAGIQGAKRTPDLVPLCHPIPIDGVEIVITPGGHGLRVTATVASTGQTGVEMEAMTAASVAALTIYDMVKSVERGVTVEQVRLLEKSGGRSGRWARSEIVD